MKLNKWLYGAAALAMLAACSEHDIDPGSGGVNKNDGAGYIAIQIGMPTNNMTRANDNFDDGLESEYAVNSLGILFFTGREEDAKFYKAYDVTHDFENEDPEDDQITSTHKVAFKVDVTQTSESLWALAVVNYTNIFSIDEKGVVKVGEKTIDENMTIKDIMALTTTKALYSMSEDLKTGSFFMTNTPYTTAPGTGSTAPTGFVHLLAAVDKEKIKESENEAKLDPASEIFVERAVAKVEVATKENLAQLTPADIEDIEEITWVIDNTEPSSYVVRHLIHNENDATKAPEWLAYTHTEEFSSNPKPTAKYRFVGYQPFNYNLSDHVDWDMYRIYFGADPNGDGIALTENKMVVTNDSIAASKAVFKSISKPQYCYENTFDVKHMDYHNTTRAILKVKFKNGTFFTRGIDRKTKYKAEDAFATFAHFAVENSDIVAAWTDKFDVATTITIKDLKCEYKDGIGTAKGQWIDLEFEVKNGRLLVKDFTIYDGEGKAEKNKVSLLEGVSKADVIAAIDDQVTFNAYAGGNSYYAVRIKHFGDDLTPWNEPTTEDGKLKDTPDTDASYGTGIPAKKNYLGRYGVLRNNWYQINIKSISKYGEPTIGDLPLDGTPDDKNDPEQAIACKINILSWAKRIQNEEF